MAVRTLTSVAEMAELLHHSEDWVMRRVWREEFPAVRVGTRTLFTDEQVDQIIARFVVEPTAEPETDRSADPVGLTPKSLAAYKRRRRKAS